MNSYAASCSFGTTPSRIASLMALFRLPTSRQGDRPNTVIISSPETGGWKLRTRSRSSKSTNLRRTNLKLSKKRCLRTAFFEVISASQSIIKSSMSSPASNNRRRTAESVTSSSAMTMGRMCSSTIFCTYFIFSFIGNFIFRKMSGTILAPIKLWLWKVHPATGSKRFVRGLPMSCKRAAQRNHKLSVCRQILSSTSSVW